MRILRSAILSAALAVAAPWATARAEVALVMVEEEGCIWCARWNAEVGDAYAQTPEGRAAPLRRVDLRAPMPEDLDLASAPRLTPTFILVRDGVELARLEGYPSEDFFWPILQRMLTEANVSVPDTMEPGTPPGEDR